MRKRTTGWNGRTWRQFYSRWVLHLLGVALVMRMMSTVTFSVLLLTNLLSHIGASVRGSHITIPVFDRSRGPLMPLKI